MIVKNANYGELSGVTVVEFGKGTVRLITAFEPKKHGDLMLRTCNKVALGHTRKLNKGEKADIKKLAPEIVFRFYKTEAIDIVIKELMNLKEAILKGEFPAAPSQVDEMSAKLMSKAKEKKSPIEFIRNTYIPEIVDHVIKKKKPVTNIEFIEFSQALYDQVKEKELDFDK